MEINGLPLHALIVHAAVVLTPLAALLALAYTAVRRWRDWLRWPVLVLAVVSMIAVWVAYLSGEQLEEANQYGAELAALVETHKSRANIFRWSATGFAAATIAATVLHRRSGPSRPVLAVIVAAAAALTLVYAALTGDAGAQVAWFGIQG